MLTTLVPPLVLIFLVLGTIFLGIATPTEGGAMGAARRADPGPQPASGSVFKLLKQAMETTGKLSSFVVFILVGSTVFGLVFRGVNGDLWVEHLLLGLPGGQVGFLIVVNILVFVLAFFLDFFELSFIIVPLLAPVADKLGIDLVWFGVLLAVNMQTSFMHPPVRLRAVLPALGRPEPTVKTTDIYWGAIPFVCIQIIMVAHDHHLPEHRQLRRRRAAGPGPGGKGWHGPTADRSGNHDETDAMAKVPAMTENKEKDRRHGSQPDEEPAGRKQVSAIQSSEPCLRRGFDPAFFFYSPELMRPHRDKPLAIPPSIAAK